MSKDRISREAGIVPDVVGIVRKRVTSVLHELPPSPCDYSEMLSAAEKVATNAIEQFPQTNKRSVFVGLQLSIMTMALESNPQNTAVQKTQREVKGILMSVDKGYMEKEELSPLETAIITTSLEFVNRAIEISQPTQKGLMDLNLDTRSCPDSLTSIVSALSSDKQLLFDSISNLFEDIKRLK